MSESKRIVVVANRLPVQRGPNDEWEPSPGGLVSAVTPLLQESGGVWVGWTGEAGEQTPRFWLDGIDHVPVSLDEGDFDAYYHGFSNATLWPNYHDAIRPPIHKRSWWRAYDRVNRAFAEKTLEVLGDGDLLWVHDYHLQLLPAMVRQARPDADIRFFLHIPFPPVEVFARLPWRRQIIEGLLGADRIVFQTDRSAENFKEAAARYAGVTWSDDTVVRNGRTVTVGSAPISIDVDEFESIASSSATVHKASEIRQALGSPRHLILGADRLDYTKGIDVRLRAFETLLQRRPDLADSTVFVQIAVPSRESVDAYATMRAQIEQIAGRINGVHGEHLRSPVKYVYESLPREDLVAYYRAADVMTVTPLVDGMNLVAKEYVASTVDEIGALVLSEFAGAAAELDAAQIVNPYDIDGMADAIESAIEAEEDEQRQRMQQLRQKLRANDIHTWIGRALGTTGPAR